MYEELIGKDEENLATNNPKLMITKILPEDNDSINKKLIDLEQEINDLSNEKIVKILKKLVPEYISKNYPFESLDGIKGEI